jgi:hypothetical protein
MTPPAAATAAGRTATPRAPRRVSGPVTRTRPAATPRGHAAPPPLGLRVAERARILSDAPLLDRLIHGRGWIGIVAVALLGIVFMQVSLLKLNAGIGADVKAAQALERSNSELRAQVARLQSGGRIHEVAGGLGLVMPDADGFRYVTAGRAGDAKRAARAIRPPDPVEQLPALATATAGAAQTYPAPTATSPAAAATATPATAPPAATPPATAPPPAAAPATTATQPGQP